MRRPGLPALVLTIAALLVTLSLGMWQIQRLNWKTDMIAEIEAGRARPPVLLGNHVTNLSSLAHRPVIAQGVYLHDLEAHITPRSYRGTTGLHVLTPLRLRGGENILVNRGWVSRERRDPVSRAQGQVGGEVVIRGILRTDFEQGLWTPDYDSKADFWFWYDVAGIAKARNLDLLPAVILADGQDNPGGLPVGGVAQIKVRNDHLQYAITWFSLAAAIAVIFLIAHRKKGSE